MSFAKRKRDGIHATQSSSAFYAMDQQRRNYNKIRMLVLSLSKLDAFGRLFAMFGGGFLAYFNYHAKAHNLIKSGHLLHFEIVPAWGNISPALVLYFDNNRPMPIREHKFAEYIELING